MHNLHGTYNGFLIILSYIIAVLASFTALDLGGRVTAAVGRARMIWLCAGAGAIFIPAAEESGLTKPLGEWVLREACRQNKQWQDAGYPLIRISVNLSIKQFEQLDLLDRITAALKETGLKPEYLELEITESMAMDVERATSRLKELKALGLHVSMDDFRTGYSSLSYLRHFPIDKLKIDQSFVRDMHEESNGTSIVATIVAMAHHMRLDVIAEGVETQEQFDALQKHQCDQIQGYFYSPPLHPEKFEDVLQASGLPRAAFGN